MSNTLSADLIPDTASDLAVTVLQTKLASLRAYTTDFSSDLVDPLRPNSIAIVTGGSTTLTNPTNFEQGDSVVTSTKITPVQLSQPFHITNRELNDGHKLERLIKVNLATLANKVQSLALAPIAKATYTNTPVVAAVSTDFDTVDVKALWASISDADEKNLVLLGSYYSELMPDNRDQFDLEGGAYGFDSISFTNSMAGAEAGTVGFAANPQALVAASRVPEMASSVRANMDTSTNIFIESLGLTVQFNMWASMSGRVQWASFDVMFGAAAADPEALTILATS